MEIPEYRIGADIGGTFTDVVVLDSHGALYRAKSFTRHDDYPQGIIDAVGKLCEQTLKVPLEFLLSHTKVFVNGTTIVTNALAQMKGYRVGLLTTDGFKDTLRIARSARTNDWNLRTQVPPPEIVARECVAEVVERVDFAGRVVVPLDEEQAMRQVKHLVQDQKIQSLAICFLWSFANPSHEQRVKDRVRAEYPQLFVTASSDLYPVSREYERMVTTVLNAFVAQGAARYLSDLESRMQARGLNVPISVMHCSGGITSTEHAQERPIHLLQSGPAGGAVAASHFGPHLGLDKVITADMGGTSFDTALIVDGQLTYKHRARVERLDTGLTLVDISSIGAGGGSICWVDDQYLPHIGPESAGSLPGPASYGRGGSEPCLTDVALVLGLLDPEYFLGGEMTLDGGAALTALGEKVVKPLQGSDQETAAGLYELAVANMSNAVRAITIERGHDPREFAVVSYGGASGLFIAKIAEELGVRRVLIPELAAVFSAVGLLFTDFVRTREKTINWSVAQNDHRQLAHLFSELQSQAAGDLREAGFEEDVEYRWEGDFKLGTQAYEVTIPIGPRTFDENSGREFLPLFRQTYERLYGPGTFWVGAEQLALIKNARVQGVGHLAKPHFPGNGPASRYVPAPDRVRRVFLPDQRRWDDVAVFLSTSLASGASFSGPGIVESFDTTVFVPQGWDVQVDSGHNVLMSQAVREGE